MSRSYVSVSCARAKTMAVNWVWDQRQKRQNKYYDHLDQYFPIGSRCGLFWLKKIETRADQKKACKIDEWSQVNSDSFQFEKWVKALYFTADDLNPRDTIDISVSDYARLLETELKC